MSFFASSGAPASGSSTTAPSPLLEIRNAEVWRGRTRVFQNLNLVLPQDRSAVILGPNGCGKTTLLQLIAGEIYPVQTPDYTFRLLGKSGWNVFALRQRMGLVSTDLQLRFKRPVSGVEVVQSGFTTGIGLFESDTLRPDARERSYECLRRLDSVHLAEKNLLEMSQGEQRRCLLARALVHDPEFLILDEPTNSLDLKATFELLAELRELLAHGRKLVLVTHNPDEILPEITHAVLMKAGAIVATGPKQELITADKLSSLFETNIELMSSNGYYRAVPPEMKTRDP